MASRRGFYGVLALCLLVNAFASPAVLRPKRLVGASDNELDSSEEVSSIISSSTSPPLEISQSDEISTQLADPAATLPPIINKSYIEMKQQYEAPVSVPLDASDDDDENFESMDPAPSNNGGSGLLSILNLGSSLFSSSSGSAIIRSMIRNFIRQYVAGGITFDLPVSTRRMDTKANELDSDSANLPSTPPKLELQETDEESDSTEDSNYSSESEEDDNNAAEEGTEEKEKEANEDAEASDGSANSDEDSDEPPEGGDGQGGGILGLLAGLSGGEDGQSDLGSLLAAVSGIVANLSGDGFDLNALIASGIGLFVGLLSEGEENPGAVISSYLLTSLDTITGGGAKNNGQFIGTFLSKLIKGTSAGGDPDASSEENGGEMPMADSAGFFLSFLMGLSGDMSKGSSGSSSHPSW